MDTFGGVAQLVSVVLIRGFDPWSGHIQETTNEYINKWDNKSMFLSLCKIIKKRTKNKTNG